ncbi:MAG: hypothetical protein GHCLOJNM_00214 [bacterium]|nr:hypothetical protein [bacterium]
MRKGGEQSHKRVGIWLRVSTEDQVKGESPEHHERRARAYAESREWTVVEVYRLDAVSGKAVMEHPEAKRMLEHVRSGHLEGLIFSKLARLARNTRELLEFADIFQAHGVDMISLQESVDTSTPVGRLFYTLIAALAQWEREEIASRVAASVPVRAKMGKPLGGKAPFGYQWVDGKLIPHPDHAPVRRRIHELFLESQRKKTVARILNESGYRTQSGKLWSAAAIEYVLSDPTAKGLHRANHTTHGNGKDGRRKKPESEWVHTEVEAIVPPELWDRCHAILTETRRNWKPRSKKPVHLFAGLAYCDCGKKMYVPSNSPKYTCARCRTKIPAEDLEAIFIEQLRGFVVSPEDIAQHLAQADRTLAEKEELLKVLEREEKSVQAEMERVYRLYIDGAIQSKRFAAKNRPLEERLSQLEDEIPRLQAEIDYMKITHLSSEQVLHEARSLYARWPSLTFDEQRRIAETITERIEVSAGEVTIHLYFLPPLENMAKGTSTARAFSTFRPMARPTPGIKPGCPSPRARRHR